MARSIKIKRAYEPPARSDGVRILVDRLWPRGVSRSDAALEEWARQLAPSTALRKWFGHDARRWSGFCERYAAELRRQPAELKRLRALARAGTLTLVYAAHDEKHNDAVTLRNVLLSRPVAR
jgi:uncharacterized protein YeaO (DUF488 family)